jgi:hypothetical protein
LGSLLNINKLLPFTVDRRKGCTLQGKLLRTPWEGMQTISSRNEKMPSGTVMCCEEFTHNPEKWALI